MISHKFLPLVLVLAACTEAPSTPASPVGPAPDGSAQVRFVDGRNCLNNQCLTFSARNRSVRMAGRYPVSVPNDIDVRNGYVTQAEFSQMFAKAGRAQGQGSGRR